MKLEDQVCSLELSKKLKELGVKQDSIFHWVISEDGEWQLYDPTEYKGWEEHLEPNEEISAFTVAELGKMLPVTSWSCSTLVSGKSFCFYLDPALNRFIEDTEADARAKMLIYLIENKLVKP